MLKITNISFPGFCANCYLATDESSGESFLVDSGAYGERQASYIRSLGVENLKYILLTHGHYDHILGVEKFREAFGGQVVIHALDEDKLSDMTKSLYIFSGNEKDFIPQKADIIVKDGDRIPFGDGEIEVIHTPGHTKGGVCYKIADVLFTGDTLFKGTIGRTDFPDSDEYEMLAALKKLYALENDFKVYPGHEGITTLNAEKQTNRYMKLCR